VKSEVLPWSAQWVHFWGRQRRQSTCK